MAIRQLLQKRYDYLEERRVGNVFVDTLETLLNEEVEELSKDKILEILLKAYLRSTVIILFKEDFVKDKLDTPEDLCKDFDDNTINDVRDFLHEHLHTTIAYNNIVASIDGSEVETN